MATNINVHDIQGGVCAWADCTAQFEGNLPAGWRWLIMWYEPTAAADMTLSEITLMGKCDRDAVLCPGHVDELNHSLKKLE